MWFVIKGPASCSQPDLLAYDIDAQRLFVEKAHIITEQESTTNTFNHPILFKTEHDMLYDKTAPTTTPFFFFFFSFLSPPSSPEAPPAFLHPHNPMPENIGSRTSAGTHRFHIHIHDPSPETPEEAK